MEVVHVLRAAQRHPPCRRRMVAGVAAAHRALRPSPTASLTIIVMMRLGGHGRCQQNVCCASHWGLRIQHFALDNIRVSWKLPYTHETRPSCVVCKALISMQVVLRIAHHAHWPPRPCQVDWNQKKNSAHLTILFHPYSKMITLQRIRSRSDIGYVVIPSPFADMTHWMRIHDKTSVRGQTQLAQNTMTHHWT